MNEMNERMNEAHGKKAEAASLKRPWIRFERSREGGGRFFFEVPRARGGGQQVHKTVEHKTVHVHKTVE